MDPAVPPIAAARAVRLLHFSLTASCTLAVASVFARRRIPERRLDQAPDTFWANPGATGAAILLWALIEGAGLVGWVGYLLTGVTAPALSAVIAIGALLVFRPSRLEGEGA